MCWAIGVLRNVFEPWTFSRMGRAMAKMVDGMVDITGLFATEQKWPKGISAFLHLETEDALAAQPGMAVEIRHNGRCEGMAVTPGSEPNGRWFVLLMGGGPEAIEVWDFPNAVTVLCNMRAIH